MTWLLAVLGLCLALSFLVSAWEGALQAIPASKVDALRRGGGRSALALSQLRERLEVTLVALFALDMAANAGVVICALSVSGAAAQAVGFAGSALATAVAAVALLFGLFLFFDLLPRAIGIAYCEAVATRSAVLIQTITRAMSPVVALGRAVTGLVPRRGGEREGPTEQDLLAMATYAAKTGGLEPREARWVSNALRLSDITVRQVLTPRSVVYALPAELPLSLVKSHSEHWAHSRLPIFRERNPDEIVGIVLRKTVFDCLLQGDTQGTLERLALPVHSIPDSMTLDYLLEWFVSKRQHIAVVRDEFQAWIGIVTLEDVLETFLGAEIVDEKDKVVDMREFARKRAAERGVRVSGVVRAADGKPTVI